MCNLYSITKPQAAIRELAKAMADTCGNLPAMPAIFPDQMAPVVMTRPYDGKRELLMMRWGFPPPGRIGSVVTNIRNTNSAWWRPYLRSRFRCLVPVTSFCENDHRSGKAVPTWFAIDESRPLFFFAGIWRSWQGMRGPKMDRVVGNHMVFSFLTTDANETVRPIHEKAMPVLLLTEQERETWMTGEVEDALSLQRPAANDAVKVVSVGAREDKTVAGQQAGNV